MFPEAGDFKSLAIHRTGNIDFQAIAPKKQAFS
jgi:hypothetical protein